MKRFFTILGLAALVAMAPPAKAQGMPGGGGLFKRITLTEQQRQQLDALHTTYQREMQQIRLRLLAGDPEAEALRTQLRERQLTQLRTMLDPEQAQAFDQNLAMVQARHNGELPGGGPPADRGKGQGGGNAQGAGPGGMGPGGMGAGGTGQGGGRAGQGGPPAGMGPAGTGHTPVGQGPGSGRKGPGNSGKPGGKP